MAKPAREPLPLLHRSSSVQPGARSKQHKVASVIVGAKQLARHLDLTHPRIAQLVDEHVLERLPSGKFNLDDSRVRYIRWLRDSERRTAKSKVDSEFVKAKTELIAIRVREKKRELIELDEAIEVSEKLIATMLVAMGGMAPRVARVAGNSLAVRREVDAIVYETRVSMANTFNKFADEAGEPPLEPAPEQTPRMTDDTEEDVPA
jgi:hypothetical protein